MFLAQCRAFSQRNLQIQQDESRNDFRPRSRLETMVVEELEHYCWFPRGNQREHQVLSYVIGLQDIKVSKSWNKTRHALRQRTRRKAYTMPQDSSRRALRGQNIPPSNAERTNLVRKWWQLMGGCCLSCLEQNVRRSLNAFKGQHAKCPICKGRFHWSH